MNGVRHTATRAGVDGRRAAEKGQPHTDNPYAWQSDYDLHLSWFAAWMIARVEFEDGIKLQVDAPKQGEIL